MVSCYFLCYLLINFVDAHTILFGLNLVWFNKSRFSSCQYVSCFTEFSLNLSLIFASSKCKIPSPFILFSLNWLTINFSPCTIGKLWYSFIQLILQTTSSVIDASYTFMLLLQSGSWVLSNYTGKNHYVTVDFFLSWSYQIDEQKTLMSRMLDD